MLKGLKMILPALIFLIIAFILWKGIAQNPHVIPSPLIGKPVPKFKAQTVYHSKTSITEHIFKGKVSVLNVFASWCMVCRAEHSVLMQMARSPSINLIGLNYKDHRKSVEAWLNHDGNPYQKIIYDPTGNIGINLGVYGTPETFIVDKKAIIRYKYIGAISPDEWKNTMLPEIKKLQQKTA